MSITPIPSNLYTSSSNGIDNSRVTQPKTLDVRGPQHINTLSSNTPSHDHLEARQFQVVSSTIVVNNEDYSLNDLYLDTTDSPESVSKSRISIF
ncbi:hypothetical protein HOG98_00240 [bacterium]|jgi:hypothetical protein|nr:hypothetical protein [bacterium]